jgi:hypothetical protein
MTKFRDVIDRASTLWRDYRLNKLFQTDENEYYTFLEGLMLNSIDMFDGCLTSLEYEEITETEDDGEIVTQCAFINTLSSKEIYILALGIMISWMTNNNNDITQMNLHMSSKDFKMYAASQNLKEKQNTLNRMREDYGRNVSDYQTKNISKISFFGGV